MATFYGTLQGNRGMASRLGSHSSGLRVSAQSYDGSVITRLNYDSDNNLNVNIEIDKDSSSCYGDTVFNGTLEELRECFKDYNNKKRGIR